MPTLYLIDGNSYFYRAFYAIRGLSTSDGFPTNAILGFTTMILKIIREKQPDYFAIVFDSPEPTEKHAMYEDYKAHRPGMPDDLKLQIPVIKDMIEAFHIHIVERSGHEADDLLAAIAWHAEQKDIDVYIVTGDKDLCQVVSPRIRLYDSMKDRITDEQNVRERFGVAPTRLPEVMALMGDASDNIPGVPGIGEKTAVKLLKEFGSLEDLIRERDTIKNKRLREAIADNLDSIELSLKLATIERDKVIEFSLEDLREKSPDWGRLKEVFMKYELKTLLNLVPDEFQGMPSHACTCITIMERQLLKNVSAMIKDRCTNRATPVAIDTETTSRSPVEAELVGISLSTDPMKAYYIPLSHAYEGVPEQLPKRFVKQELKDILENACIQKVGHNIKYDMIVLKSEGIDISGIAFDTMIASYLMNPNRSQHGLEDVAMNHLSIKKLAFKDILGSKKTFKEVLIEDAARYAGEDAAVTMGLKQKLEPQLEKEGLSALLFDMELPLVEVLADMEMSGIKIDIAGMKSLSRRLQKELNSIEKKIYHLAGEEFNINSSKQLQEILFEKLGLRTIRKIKTGFSTDVGVLEQLKGEHELPGEILEYRVLSKLRNTYVEALPKLVNTSTGRLHTSFNQTIAATGRLSSSEPNLQNIPIRGEWGRHIRKTFVAEEGHLLLSSDYSQIELRILAHLSGDEGLIDVFNRGGDIHARTASGIFGLPTKDITDEMRRRAKVVNFGILYGMSPFGLSRELGISPGEARNYIDRYFSQYEGVRAYIKELVTEAAEAGYVTTLFNRKRAIPELRSKNRNTRQLGERIAVNTPIQGSAADIIKIAMLRIHRRIKDENLGTRLLLQVHDELLLEVPVDEQEDVKALVRNEMVNVIRMRVPLEVDIGIGRNWAEAH